MPFCPECRAEYRPGFDRCSDCDVALTDEAPPPAPGHPIAGVPDDEWETIYAGRGANIGHLEAHLDRLGVPRLRLPGGTSPIHGVKAADIEYVIAIPRDIYAERPTAIDGLVTSVTGVYQEDAGAMAEAEEDYDVRACPNCVLFFSQVYAACPGCSATLVPAVECFEDGQLEPDRVIVADGAESEMKTLAEQFGAANFSAEAFAVDDWEVAAVDLPWLELTDRTAEVERVLAARG